MKLLLVLLCVSTTRVFASPLPDEDFPDEIPAFEIGTTDEVGNEAAEEPKFNEHDPELIYDPTKNLSDQLEVPQTLPRPDIVHEVNDPDDPVSYVGDKVKSLPSVPAIPEEAEVVNDYKENPEVKGHVEDVVQTVSQIDPRRNSAKEQPRIVVTPPENEFQPPVLTPSPPRSFWEFTKIELPSPQKGFDHLTNFQFEKIPLSPSSASNFFKFPNSKPVSSSPGLAKQYGPYEKEFEERTSSSGQFTQEGVLNHGLKISQLLGDLKKVLRNALAEFVENDKSGNGAIQICKMAQSRVVLNNAVSDFLNNFHHFVKLDGEHEVDADCRLKAYRVLRTLEDALEQIRNGLDESVSEKLDPNWTDLSSAISDSIQALTRKTS